ncbi:3'-5' exonuclease [Planctobacterium marinum]|uniref:Exonuclease domain-containing protein n=1 Tax=Planctobacterium marinum TaxID=1631968 RepID=A0AA48KQ15_9ALTE|nr:hypothetical protein MACH26_01280 [Planctobacterium marinum]
MSSLVIFDTEFTAWPGSREHNWSRQGEAREIIQLAALKIKVQQKRLSAVASFNVLVKPTINPNLSEYIQELTGIRQQVVEDHGVDYPSCAELFHEFIENGTLPCYSWGPDVKVLKENHHFNQKQWLYREDSFIDLKTCIKSKGLPFTQLISGDLAAKVDKPLVGHKHNALYDVKSILVFLQTLIEQNRLDLSDLYLE